jgi:hypothetical protein
MLGNRLNERAYGVLVLSWLVTGCAATAPQDELLYGKQVGPFKQCRWDLVNGHEPFENSAPDANFDARYNPTITISRRGLTARVVGVLSEDTLARFGGSIEAVVAAYPHLTPVRYTARHTVRSEDLERSASWRRDNPRGEITATEVVELPPNAVMIVYPVSIAADRYNTAAGNWVLESKDRARPNDDKGPFARFPFLKYTWQGHAMHGPITGDRETDSWGLRRGKVSHGCNRMEGEHVIELAVLLGCPAAGNLRSCGFANESVTVMEEFDYIPDPAVELHDIGIVSDYAEVYQRWVSPDVAGFPRDSTYPLNDDLRFGADAVLLDRSLNKAWGQSISGVTDVLRDRPGDGVVRLRAFRTWDNRDHEGGVGSPFIRSSGCSG